MALHRRLGDAQNLGSLFMGEPCKKAQLHDPRFLGILFREEIECRVELE
ncbi:MAG: hypothetical protein RLZZ253_1475 [Verrucomicrobiota bacterium]